MEITNDIKNVLMKRQEVTFSLESTQNPNFIEMKQLISKETGKDEEVIDVYSIKGNFGKNSFVVKANIYENKEDLEKYKSMNRTKKERDAAKKAAQEAYTTKKEADTAPATTDAAPAEETAPDAPVEETALEAAPATTDAAPAEETKPEEKSDSA
jgi:ribosomal protein S24E